MRDLIEIEVMKVFDMVSNVKDAVDEILKIAKFNEADSKVGKLRKNPLGYTEWKKANNIQENGCGSLDYNGNIYTAYEINKMYEKYKWLK